MNNLPEDLLSELRDTATRWGEAARAYMDKLSAQTTFTIDELSTLRKEEERCRQAHEMVWQRIRSLAASKSNNA